MTRWHWFVYIIECNDGLYYTGVTWDLEKRFDQHKTGNGANFTKKHGVKRLVYSEEYFNIDDARKRERQIKDWSRKKKKLLIEGNLFN